MLIKGMTEQEIRVLQEFSPHHRRHHVLTAVKAIKHPTGGGEAPAFSLVARAI